MNTPVSFELAKLLKKKEFGLKVFHFYQGDNLNQNGDCFLFNHSIRGDHYISAPTIAEVVMWLYEKHGIWIYTRPFSSGHFHGYIVDNSGEMKEAINNVNFNSPTEAYEAAIEHVLKNLINEGKEGM